MPRLTFAGQIDQPASLRLERAGNERTCDACTTKADCEFVSYCWRCNSRLLNVAAQEVAALSSKEGIVVDETPPVAAAPTLEPSPREAPKDDGWIAWSGLSRQGPVECIGKTIEVRYRSGIDNQIFTTNGEGALWDHTETNGIIAYRLVEPRK